jgi:hypothetical protein
MTETKGGEWYWGAKCPHCGDMAAHSHDPTRGDEDAKPAAVDPAAPHVEVQCPKGHRFSVRTRDLLQFEWGAQ